MGGLTVNKILVYGTLKRGGGLHNCFDGKYLGTFKVPGFKMFNFGWFPGIIEDEDSSIYAEMYEIDSDTLENLDRIEGEGRMYNRTPLRIADDDCYIYVAKMKLFWQTWKGIPGRHYVPRGFWVVQNKEWKIDSNFDENSKPQIMSGTGAQIVFDLRFFDTSAGRCSTNKEYMELVKFRMFDLDVNTEVEDIFITDLLILGKVKEVD